QNIACTSRRVASKTPALLRPRSSAADLKFRIVCRKLVRNFKSTSGTKFKYLLVPLLFPKFVSEGAAMYHELRKRALGSASIKRILPRLRPVGFRDPEHAGAQHRFP